MNLNEFSDLMNSIPGVREYCVGSQYGGDPYLHARYDPAIGVCAFHIDLKETVPQAIVDQIPLMIENGYLGQPEPVMVIFARQDNRGFWGEVKRRLHTGEVMDTPDWTAPEWNLTRKTL